MISLSAYGRAVRVHEEIAGRVAFAPVAPEARPDTILAFDASVPPDTAGYAGLLVSQPLPPNEIARLRLPTVHGMGSLTHLAEGDVVALQASGHVRTLYRRGSRHNSLFATDRCNSLCLMCSQPPKEVSDDGRAAFLCRQVDLMDPETEALGITGGEPTLLGDGLLAVIARCWDRLPRTALHLLSNGRLFAHEPVVAALAELNHPDLMVGIPVYADVDFLHDHIVQARGAFDETMLGLHNLARYGVPVEIRVVLHRLTCARLPQLAEFIYRNLTFAAHVTFMGLEPIGLAIPNLPDLWIDPWDYRAELEEATLHLATRGVRVSVYNHQLCILPQTLWPYAARSISDWKNDFLPVCTACSVRDRCAGFFTSGVQRAVSAHIHSMLHPADFPSS